MKGVILSHTRMGTRGLCTAFLVDSPTGPRQIRPRLPPNEAANLGTFGYSDEQMQQLWQPGRVVSFPGYTEIPQAHRRCTHPEDVYMTNPAEAVVQTGATHTPAALAQLVAPFTYASLRALYPHMQMQGNDKAYTPPNAQNPASVGYVRCTVRLQADERVTVHDEEGRMINCKMKDETRLPLIRNGHFPVGTRWANVLVRFSLANAFFVNGPDQLRCYIMLSHIVD